MKKTQKLTSIILCGVLLLAVLSCLSTGGGASIPPVLATGEWMTYDDRASDGGSSSSVLTEAEEVINGETVKVKTIRGNVTEQFVYGFAGWGIDADNATMELYKNASALSFWILGDGKRYSIKFKISTVEDYCYHEYTFQTTAGEAEYIEVPMMFFMQPAWGQNVRFDPTKVTGVEWQTHESWRPGSFQVKMWDFKVHPGAPKKGAKPTANTTPGVFKPFDLALADNFQYGNGYQGVIKSGDLLDGYRIRTGDTFTLKITYTASRDLENDLCVGFADTSPAANYWKALSWAQRGDESPNVTIPASKKGEKVTAEVKITAVAGASSASAAANALIFETVGEGRKGSAGSGKQGRVTLSFTEFVLTKD